MISVTVTLVRDVIQRQPQTVEGESRRESAQAFETFVIDSSWLHSVDDLTHRDTKSTPDRFHNDRGHRGTDWRLGADGLQGDQWSGGRRARDAPASGGGDRRERLHTI